VLECTKGTPGGHQEEEEEEEEEEEAAGGLRKFNYDIVIGEKGTTTTQSLFGTTKSIVGGKVASKAGIFIKGFSLGFRLEGRPRRRQVSSLKQMLSYR